MSTEDIQVVLDLQRSLSNIKRSYDELNSDAERIFSVLDTVVSETNKETVRNNLDSYLVSRLQLIRLEFKHSLKADLSQTRATLEKFEGLFNSSTWQGDI